MSTRTIDQRVVEMQFDNKQFERNVATSISSLDKLKQSLKLDDASRGLENVSDAARKCDVSVVGQAAEKVGLKFNVLWTMADQALRNITNSAITAGKRIASALTIDPIKTGFSEYETKMGAIQTILSNTSSKGTTMDDVTEVLGELNTYADKTIYNFAEMTNNIGRFTAAGVGLEDSAAAIQGIANLAASSGSTSQQASTAMYQLSQALAAGSLKLQDWNSVVNAGMGGTKFQDALKATAKDHGVAVDEMIEKYGSFRNSLQEGWITTDILNETLRKFTVEGAKEYAQSMVDSGKYTQAQADALIAEAQAMEDAATKVKTFTQLWDTLKESAQSGWAQTWEIIVGDFEEAKEFLTKVSDVIGGIIGKSADARNELLENWKVLGGRTDLIESIENIFEGVSSIIKPIKEAFREIFPPMTAEKLKAFTSGLKELTAKLKIGDGTANKLKRTFKGLFAVVSIAKQIFTAVFKAVTSVLGVFDGLGGGVLGVTACIGDWLVALNDAIKYGEIFEFVFQGIAKAIELIIKPLKIVIGFIANTFIFPVISSITGLLEGFSNNMGKTADSAVSMKERISNAFDSLGSSIANNPVFKAIHTLWKGIVTVGTAIAKFIGTLIGGFVDKLSNATFEDAIEILNSLVSGGIAVGLLLLVAKISKAVKLFQGILGDLSDAVSSFAGNFTAEGGVLETVKTIAASILVLAAGLLILSYIDSDKLSESIAAMATLFVELAATMAILSKVTNGKDTLKANALMLSLSVSLLILSSALVRISKLDRDSMLDGVMGIAALMTIIVAAMKVLSSGKGAIVKGGLSLIAMSTALYMMTGVLKIIIAMPNDEGQVWEAVAIVGAISAIAAGIMLMSRWVKATSFAAVAGAMNAMGTALLIMTGVIAIIVHLPNDNGRVWQAVGVIGALVALAFAMAILANYIKPSKFAVITASMNAMGTALAIMAGVLAAVAAIPNDNGQLNRALGVVSGLTALSFAMALLANYIKPSKFAVVTGAMNAMATALLMMSGVIAIIASIPNDKGQISQAVGVVAALIGLSAIMMVLASNAKPSKLAIATGAMNAMGTALLIMTGVLAIITALPDDEGQLNRAIETVVVLTALYGAMLVLSDRVRPAKFAVAAGAMNAMAAALLIMTGVLAILCNMPNDQNQLTNAGIVLAGFVAMIGGLALVTQSVNPSKFAVMAGSMILFGVACIALAGAVAILGSVGLEGVGIGLLGLAAALAIVLIASLVLQKAAPGIQSFATAVLELGLAMAAVGAGVAAISVALATFGGGAAALAAAIPIIVSGVVAGLGILLEGIIGLISTIVEAIGGLIVGILGLIVDIMPAIVEAVVAIIVGICSAILQALPSITEVIIELVKAVCQILVECVPIIAEAIFTLLVGLLQKLVDYTPTIVSLLFEFLIKILEGIAKYTPVLIQKVVDILMAVLQGTIDALSSIDPAVLTQGLLGIAAIAGLMAALAAVSGLIPQAMIGVIGMGLVIAELALVLAAVGQLTKIPGLMDAISDGGNLLQVVGTAIGQFIGGLAGGFSAGFADSLPAIGVSLSKFMTASQPFFDGLKNIDDRVMTGAKALVGVILSIAAANVIESIASWLTGESSIMAFATELPLLGAGLAGFSAAVANVNPEAVKAAASAAKSLAEMTKTIPNSGGVVSWFAGDNSISAFGEEIPKLGRGLKGFADAVAGIIPENVKAAADAAKSLAEMTKTIPNSGGVVSWFAGDNSISAFADEIPKLGAGLKGFADAVTGISPEAVVAAASAAKSLAEMTNSIPNSGGVVSWFAGDNSISKFADEIVKLGKGIKDFSDASIGVNPEVTCAAVEAAKSLVDMTKSIPDSGGVVSWFAGDNSISTFADELPKLGSGIKGFSDAVVGVIPENVKAAASAAQSLAEMTNHIPKEGGMKAWFSGETSITKFSDELPKLGSGLSGFSKSVAGIIPENVSAAAGAAKDLAQMAGSVPKKTDNMLSFGDNISAFGAKLKAYFDNTKGITAQAIQTSSEVVASVKNVASIDSNGISGAAKAIDSVTTAIKNMASIPKNATSEFTNAMTKLGETSTDSLVESFADLGPKLKKVAAKAISDFVDGIKEAEETAKKACSQIATACVDALKEKYEKFYNAGSHLVNGFASGISENDYKAAAKARAMAKAAAEAAEDALDINSPSKVFYGIGKYSGDGFVNALDSYVDVSYDAGSNMADSARRGLSDAIRKIESVINGDMDMQPTIRPVLDLSEVKSGANSISSLLGGASSARLLSNVGVIGSMMNNRNQNGGNSDVIAAIDKLRKDVGKVGGTTYNINGVTYDDGSNISDAVETIVRAARIERRM